MSVRKQKQKSREGKIREFWIVDIKYEHPNGTVERVRKVPRRQTRVAAQKLERDIFEKLASGGWGKPSAPDRHAIPSFQDFSLEFQETYAANNNKASEIDSKRQIIENHLTPYFGRLQLDQISAELVEKYKGLKKKQVQPRTGKHGYAAKTINNHLIVLGRIMRVACEWKKVSVVPVIKHLKTTEPDFDFLDFDEASHLLAHTSGHLQALLVVLLNTGIRIGEARALRWESVDLRDRKLRIVVNDWRGHEDTPKGGYFRTLPLNKAACEAFANLHRVSPYVFTTDSCKMGDNDYVKPLWSACKRAGMRKVTWHVMRHSFASHLVMKGVPLMSVAELLGHSTTKVTERYGHLSPQFNRDAVERLDMNQGQYRGNTKLPLLK